jgi:hypothetical protein
MNLGWVGDGNGMGWGWFWGIETYHSVGLADINPQKGVDAKSS